MTSHTMEVHFKVDALGGADPTGSLAKSDPLRWTHFFKNFNLDPNGHIIIKNFHPAFRDRLQAVLMDEGLPFSPILPVVPRL